MHTPGPWGRSGNHIMVRGRGTIAICPNPSGDGGVFEMHDNARLIAAAPDLLREVQRAYEREYNPFEPDNQSAAYHRIALVLQHATGERP